jgi:hypothetical protein
MFLRFVGQAVGAAGCGAVLNFSMQALDPTAARAVDGLLGRTARAALEAQELVRLTEVLALSLRNAYALAAVFAVVTVLIATALPRGLNPRIQVKPD